MGNIAKRANGKWRARYRDDSGPCSTPGTSTGRSMPSDGSTRSRRLSSPDSTSTQKPGGSRSGSTPRAGAKHRYTGRRVPPTSRECCEARLPDVRRPADVEDPAVGGTGLGAPAREHGQASRPDGARRLKPSRCCTASCRRSSGRPCATGRSSRTRAKGLVSRRRRPSRSCRSPPSRSRCCGELDARRAQGSGDGRGGHGMRQGEVFGLTVDRIDFLRREVRVDRQIHTRPGRGNTEFGPTKTPASARTIPLPQVVVDAFAGHLRDHPAGQHRTSVHPRRRAQSRGTPSDISGGRSRNRSESSRERGCTLSGTTTPRC